MSWLIFLDMSEKCIKYLAEQKIPPGVLTRGCLGGRCFFMAWILAKKAEWGGTRVEKYRYSIRLKIIPQHDRPGNNHQETY
jgi:hypothetical protein